MKIVEIKDRNSLLIEQLLGVWESSVKATHLFLSENEIESIKKYVPQALNEIPHLIIVENENQVPLGFMGIVEQHLEMLFISHEERGKGLGKELPQYGIEKYSINDLAVNEQNPLAKGFYEHIGFKVYKRTDNDEQGNPYPLLYMSRIKRYYQPSYNLYGGKGDFHDLHRRIPGTYRIHIPRLLQDCDLPCSD